MIDLGCLALILEITLTMTALIVATSTLLLTLCAFIAQNLRERCASTAPPFELKAIHSLTELNASLTIVPFHFPTVGPQIFQRIISGRGALEVGLGRWEILLRVRNGGKSQRGPVIHVVQVQLCGCQTLKGIAHS